MADYKSSRGTGSEGQPIPSGRKLVSGYNQDTPFEQAVKETMKELGDLLLSKHKDYGPKNISDSPGGPLNGLRVRMHDKTARINNLIDSKQDARHEPLEDSFKDLANYAIIALLVLRGKWDK